MITRAVNDQFVQVRCAVARGVKSGGFTLVELLLAVALLSILMALTYTGLRSAARAAESGENILVADGEVRAAHQFIRRQLNQMLPLPFAVANDENETRIVFSGDAQHIQFVAPMPGYLGSGGPQVQLLELANGDGGSVLQFSNALLQGFEQHNLSARDPVIVLSGVSAATFAFLGRDEKGEIAGWTNYWDQPDVLPVAVRLSLEFSDDSHARWPDLVGAVRIDAQSVLGGTGKATYQQTIKDLSRLRSQVKS